MMSIIVSLIVALLFGPKRPQAAGDSSEVNVCVVQGGPGGA